MTATSKATVFISGKIYWAKILGEPRPNYNRDGREWALEFEPDEAGLDQLRKHKLDDRFKDKYEDRGTYISLRKTEFNRDGNPNPPIRVYDGNDEDWDSDTLIGNGSVGDLKLDIRNYGPGKKSGVYPVALRVRELIRYQSSEFGGMDRPEVEVKAGFHNPEKDTFAKDFELDDEIPV